jgi:uncharacterized membrane-anchored protein
MKLATTPETAMLVLDSHLKNYNVSVGEDGSIEILTKEGTKPVIDNKAITDINEISKHILETNKLLVLNNNQETPNNGKQIKGNVGELPKEYAEQLERLRG